MNAPCHLLSVDIPTQTWPGGILSLAWVHAQCAKHSLATRIIHAAATEPLSTMPLHLLAEHMCPWQQRCVVVMQGRIEGYYFGSEIEADFQECRVPRSPSPPPRPTAGEVRAAAAESEDAALAVFSASHQQGAVPRGPDVPLIDQIPSRATAEGHVRANRWDQGSNLESYGSDHSLRRSRSTNRSLQGRRGHSGRHELLAAKLHARGNA